MNKEKITYYLNKERMEIEVKICDTFFSKLIGLMFRKNSLPLLFIFNKEKNLSIHSLFCKPFTAIWLDKNMKATKLQEVKKLKFNISGYGKYLLEIPLVLNNDDGERR